MRRNTSTASPDQPGSSSRLLRRVAAATVIAASTLGLAACGGSSSDSAGSKGSYCDKVKALGDFEAKMTALDPTDMNGTISALAGLSTDLKEVADVAPDDIKPEWDKVTTVFTELSTALAPLKDLDLSDPTKIDPKLLTDLQALAPKMQSLQSDMAAATDAIDVHTTKECGFALGAP